MAKSSTIPKKFSDCYLYQADLYEADLVRYINRATVLDKDSDKFVDIMNIFKNTYPRWLYKFVNSKELLFLVPAKNAGVHKAFNGFACVKKDQGKAKVVALVNAYILDTHLKTNKFVLNSTQEAVMLGYIVSAFTSYTYLTNPNVYTKNAVIIKDGAETFSRFICYILHYMYKINSIPKLSEEVKTLSKMYYYVNMLRMDISKAKALVIRETKLTSLELEILNIDDEGLYENINTLITKAFANMDLMSKLTTAAFVEKWITLFGAGTEFALELLPSFLTMMSNQYVSSYACNINLIQNVAGKRNKLGLEVMKIGGKING